MSIFLKEYSTVDLKSMLDFVETYDTTHNAGGGGCVSQKAHHFPIRDGCILHQINRQLGITKIKVLPDHHPSEWNITNQCRSTNVHFRAFQKDISFPHRHAPANASIVIPSLGHDCSIDMEAHLHCDCSVPVLENGHIMAWYQMCPCFRIWPRPESSINSTLVFIV